MKRNIFALTLCLCLIFTLISGCASETPATEVPTTEMSITEVPATEVPVPEAVQPEEKLSVLTKVSEIELQTYESTELYTLGENLLVASWGEFDDTETYGYFLSIVSADHGEVLEARQVKRLFEEEAFSQDHVMVGTETGECCILDSALSVVDSYQPITPTRREHGYPDVDQPWYLWYSPDFQIGYSFPFVGEVQTDEYENMIEEYSSINDLVRVDPKTGMLTKMKTDLRGCRFKYYAGGQYMVVTHETPEGTVSFSLDLHTGEMEEAPVRGEALDRVGNTWLLRDSDDSGKLYVHTSEGTTILHCDTAETTPYARLMNEQHLLLRDSYDRRCGTLYDLSGKFLSRYEFPESKFARNPDAYVSGPVWSEAADGYYLLLNTGKTCELYFWDISVPMEGESLGIG